MNLGNIGRLVGRHTFAAPLAALTLVAGGGIALAASGGPAPQAVEHRVAQPTHPPSVESAADLSDNSDNSDNSDDSDDSDDGASPSPSLTGLCKAYRAGGYASSTKHGHVNPAWSALESAAGGSDDIDDYCDDRLDDDDKPGRGPNSDRAERDDDDDDDSGQPGNGRSHGFGHGNH